LIASVLAAVEQFPQGGSGADFRLAQRRRRFKAGTALREVAPKATTDAGITAPFHLHQVFRFAM
jgi:hypothetical protein